MTTESALTRIAIVGAGYFGQFHYDAWSRIEGCEIVGAVDPDAHKAREVAARYGGFAVFTDAAEMARAVLPDLIDITAPPGAHLEIIRATAPHAKAIICQKPFCGGTEAAGEAIALCDASSTRIAVHENIRFQPWNRAARRIIDAGTLGTPYQITFRLRPGDGQGPEAYLDRQPYFQQMARFMVHETAIHWIDTFRYLMGEVTGVMAHLSRLNPAIAGEDAGIIIFQCESGARALFDGNRLSDHIATNRRRTLGEMVIEGSKGTLRLDGEGRLWLRAFGSNEEIEQIFDWRDHLFGGDCVYECNRHIIGAWRAGRASEMDAAAYIRNQMIEDAVYLSAEQGRFVEV